MNKDYLADVYKDFFGESTLALEKEEEIKEDFNIEEIDSLLIEEESKDLLKKVITYIKDYVEKKENNYLDFNFIIQSDNKEVIKKIEDILKTVNSKYKYLNGDKASKCSFYDNDTLDKIREVFNSKIIILKDLKGFELRDDSFKKSFFHLLGENLDNKMIIIEGVKEEIDYLFEYDSLLRNNKFPFVLIGKDPDVLDVYHEVLGITKLSEEDEFSLKVLDYISDTYPKKYIDYINYRDNLCREIALNHEVPKVESEKSLDEIFEKLNELVGLEKVKKTLHELVDYMNLQKKSTDLKLNNINLHMVFLGNPGTGKTTVARIIVDILYNLKYIKQNKLIEVSSKDLVAEYVGQTAPKTMSVVERAMGGVLFIDEAYALANDAGQNSYNAEAIATLIKAMEDYRDELVVIFAGYTKEMQAFLDSNSGIVSRIGYTLEFDDYTEDELVKIFEGMMKKAGFTVEDDAYLELRKIIRENKDNKNFGNARFVRNVYEKTIIKHAANTRNKKRKSILATIKKEDISCENIRG